MAFKGRPKSLVVDVSGDAQQRGGLFIDDTATGDLPTGQGLGDFAGQPHQLGHLPLTSGGAASPQTSPELEA